ncbi:MAG TPA: thioredoxin domain-containing protein [Candidatus Limnocylindrales bacterium]|nr:thioredoxin domain-containing protein [Candidatus Limnocylindrales bacterium]
MAPEKNTPKTGQSGLTPKQLADQARAESEAAERRRERTIRIVGGLVVLLVVGGLLAVGYIAGRDGGTDSSASPPPTPDANAALPSGVSGDNYGVPYGTGWTSPDEAKLPTLEIWEDFQCPACAQVEAVSGDGIQALADAGKVKLLYRPAIFLDASLAADNAANGNPNSSARATSAWGCAVDAGKAGEYHSAVFDIQPADEGVGFSDQQLIELGTTVGIADADLATYTTCVQEGTYLSWAANSNQAFSEAGVGGTPTAYLNGVELNSADLADLEGLTQKIDAATAQ